MGIGIWEIAQRTLRDFGDMAEEECGVRAAYHDRQGDKAVADGWRRVKETLAGVRLGGNAANIHFQNLN